VAYFLGHPVLITTYRAHCYDYVLYKYATYVLTYLFEKTVGWTSIWQGHAVTRQMASLFKKRWSQRNTHK